MTFPPNTPQLSRPRWSRSPVVLVVLVGLFLGVLTFSPERESAAQECPEGSVLSDNGVTCELDVGSNGEGDTACPAGQELDAAGLLCVAIQVENPTSVCPAGQRLDAAGLRCEEIPAETDSICPPGQELDAAGLRCVSSGGDGDDSASSGCQPGFSLGRDGETCIADGPRCENNEVLDDKGQCVKTFQCPAGLILTSDLLRCISDKCPDGELLSVDGRRCVAPDSDCPDGSPRPVGGACLVVETIEGPDGETEVVVRCAEADVFCQSRIKQCADARASGADLSNECADPRGSCADPEADCAEANDRLVECATRDIGEDEDGNPVRIGGADDPCTDLCPDLHRLDPSGECIEYLDPTHPCVSFGQVPPGVTTNAELNGYSYLAGLSQCVTRAEFLRRLGNFEAAAGAEAEALSLLRETTSSYLTVEGQLAELEQRLVEAEREIRAFTEAAADADYEVADNRKLLAATGKRLARERSQLQNEVLHAYVFGGNDALIEGAILASSNITEVSVAQLYGEALLDDQVANIRRVESLEASMTDLSIALDRAAKEVQASLDSAIESSESLEHLLSEAENLRSSQLQRRDLEAELVAALRDDKAGFAQELGIFEQASREIADIISDAEFRVTAFSDFDGLLADPILPEAKISSGFGPRLHPILGYVRNHNGVDITAPFGKEIVASADGVVQIARTFGGYGETVVIDHGGGILTLYAHLSVFFVEAGDDVEIGETIGLVGSTGLSTGPHLHFEVWENGNTAVDPVPYLITDS